jgi:two-component system chemotaxis response regulator CheB
MKRILIVDDSSVFRSEIRRALSGLPGIDIVGTVANGKLGLEFLEKTAVDLAIVDIEMPEMNGLELIDALSAKGINVPVIVFASATKSSALMALKALNRGARDFVMKPQASGLSPSDAIREALLPKLNGETSSALSLRTAVKDSKRWVPIDWSQFLPRAIVIGSSTGGPRALEEVLKKVGPVQKCPIFIVQHMPPVFTSALGEHLSDVSGLKAREAKHGEYVNSETVYIAPGDYHMILRRDDHGVVIELNQNAQVHSVRPAVDLLFRSASEVYRRDILAAVLTGMGEDGKNGCVAIKEVGGAVLIQDAVSCVVYGMPRAVNESGAFDKQVALDSIRDHLISAITGTKRAA